MKKLLLLLTTLFIFQGCTGTTTSSSTSVMLILYSYPTQWNADGSLTALREATDGDFVTVINPSNGPGYTQDDTFTQGIDSLYNQDIKVVVYIYTSYTQRPKKEIYDDIDTYLEFYGAEKIAGIFFDEVAIETQEEQAYMKDISQYARTKGFNFIVLNPGTTIPQSIMNENYYNIILSYENSYQNYIKFTNTLTSSKQTKQAVVVYDYPELLSYKEEIQKAKNMHFDYIYFTTDNGSNPFDTVFNFLR